MEALNEQTRITPRIPEALARELRAIAAYRGQSFESIIAEALETFAAKNPVKVGEGAV